MGYLYLKSFHIVFVVSWFAGLFYLVRLFIYHTEAGTRPEQERQLLHQQFMVMERRLWQVITMPAMILTVLTGASLLYLMPEWLSQPWMQLKLSFVLGLIAYHFRCRTLMIRLAEGISTATSFRLRLWNEVATVFLVSIVFLVVLKTAVDWLWAVLGFIGFGVLLMLAVKLVKKRNGQRMRNQESGISN